METCKLGYSRGTLFIREEKERNQDARWRVLCHMTVAIDYFLRLNIESASCCARPSGGATTCRMASNYYDPSAINRRQVVHREYPLSRISRFSADNCRVHHVADGDMTVMSSAKTSWRLIIIRSTRIEQYSRHHVEFYRGSFFFVLLTPNVCVCVY